MAEIFDIAINDKLTPRQLEFISKACVYRSKSFYEIINYILANTIKNDKNIFYFDESTSSEKFLKSSSDEHLGKKYVLKTCLFLDRTNLKSITKLDLVLTKDSLPDGIGEFIHLEKLNITLFSETPILNDYLPKSMEKLSKLTDLSIRIRNIFLKQKVKVPLVISKLVSLKNLKIVGNKANVSFQEMRHNDLDPRDLGRLQNTETLPEDFGNLTHLITLKLNDINLKALPESFGKLTNLTTLYICNSGLSELPSLKNLVSLKRLRIENTYLDKIPEEITQLPNLEILNFHYNDLVKLPNLGGLTKLKVLNLSDNNLGDFPDGIDKLTNLEILNLSSSKLASIPVTIGNLTQLRILNLEGNHLKGLPNTIGNLTQLQFLNLNLNQLMKLPEMINNLKSLRSLKLRLNSFTRLDLKIENFPKLSDFYRKQILALLEKIKGIANVISCKVSSYEHCALCLQTVDEGFLFDISEGLALKTLKEHLDQNKPYTHLNNGIPHNDFLHYKCWQGLERCPICRQI